MTKSKGFSTGFLSGIVVLFLCMFNLGDVFGTHNRAGEITYEKLGTYTYRATIVTYTKTSSPADRPELEFWWGDGSRDTVPRNSIAFNVGPDIQRNTYIATHVYPGPGSYVMYFLDENRNANVVNIPGSVNIPFYVETQLVISPAFLTNSSPQLLQPPIDNGSVNRIFIHNPNAFDPDGDSLSYELTPCKGFGGAPVPGYVYPSASSSFLLDAITGDLIWDAPQLVGEYNVAMIIREWRTIPGIGLLNIGYVTRDMQITIYPPVNDPPEIPVVADTCVEAGSSLVFTVNASDPNPSETVALSATGGPFTLASSPASFTSTPGQGSVSGVFSWNTVCAHVRNSPYTVVFKAEDNNTQVTLADLEAMSITVVGPAPTNPTAIPAGNSLELSWNQSACTEAVGYKVYRRVSIYGFTPGYCETGVPSYTGYTLLATVNGLTDTSYTDDDNGAGLAPAVQYCYMVTAFYPDGAESYASVEFCGKLVRDLPVITNVDVVTTSPNSGSVYVAWGKPTELDTVQTPGPFRYVVQRAKINEPFDDVVTLFDLNDTIFTDGGLNTRDSAYRYRIQLWNDTVFLIGTTQVANSIFLDVDPGDEKNRLTWSESVPWTNTSYVVYRESIPGVFDSIGVTTSLQYVDDSLQNGVEYCYYVKSIGAYQDTGLVDPILNRSQQVCSVPVDNEPPCPPFLVNGPNCVALLDTLSWTIDDSCSADAELVNVYYSSASGGGVFTLIHSSPASSSPYIYVGENSIAGCYYVTAVDSNGNEGGASNVVCTGPCPLYVLPNSFSPDGSGKNDVYHPIYPYRDIERVDMRIFNRWGDQVFKTEDPEIGWNGKRENAGPDSPEGVYFYVCKVYEVPSVAGEVSEPRILNGFIHLIRGN